MREETSFKGGNCENSSCFFIPAWWKENIGMTCHEKRLKYIFLIWNKDIFKKYE